MSWQAISQAYKRALPPGQKAVLLALAFDVNRETGQCNPSIRRLVAHTGYSERHIQGILNELEASGVILIRRSNGGRSSTNSYTINPAHSAGLQDDKPRTQFRVSRPETPQSVQKTPQSDAENPAHSAPDPFDPYRTGGEERSTERDKENRKRLQELKAKCLR